jgi:hypothetical protein
LLLENRAEFLDGKVGVLDCPRAERIGSVSS